MNARQKAKHYKRLLEMTPVPVNITTSHVNLVHYKTRKNVFFMKMLSNGNKIEEPLMEVLQNEIAREMFDVVKDHITYDLVYEGSVPYVTGEIFIGERI